MQGKEVDMEALMSKHELTTAVGNVRMNARGDMLGPGGKITKTREEVAAAYYEDNPNAIPKRAEPAVKTAPPVVESKPVEKVAPTVTSTSSEVKKKV